MLKTVQTSGSISDATLPADTNDDRVIRVLHAFKVYLPDVDGGIATAIRMLAGGQRPESAGTVLVARDRGFGGAITVDGVPVQRVSSLGTFWSMPLAPTYPVCLSRAARRHDLVAHHFPFPLTDITVSLGWLPKRTALVVHWHAEILKQRLLLKVVSPFIQRTLERADAVVVSHPSIIETSPFLSAVRDKCRVVPYGIRLLDWTVLNDEARTRVALLSQRHPRLIVTTGRLVGYKGFNVLIDAMTQVNGELIICGTGVLEATLRQQIERLRLGDRVRMAGYLSQEDLKCHLHAASVFAFPSVNNAEAFGLVQAEAMACGKPIVNTSLPTGVPWVARHEQEALTVPPGDSVALADALNRLLDDRELRARLGANASLRAQNCFGHDRFRNDVFDVYRGAIAGRGH